MNKLLQNFEPLPELQAVYAIVDYLNKNKDINTVLQSSIDELHRYATIYMGMFKNKRGHTYERPLQIVSSNNLIYLSLEATNYFSYYNYIIGIAKDSQGNKFNVPISHYYSIN